MVTRPLPLAWQESMAGREGLGFFGVCQLRVGGCPLLLGSVGGYPLWHAEWMGFLMVLSLNRLWYVIIL